MAGGSVALTGDESLSACIGLLSSLSASPDASIDIETFSQRAGMSEAQIDIVLELIQSISDERTGSRIAIVRDGSTLRLIGDAGRLSPIRLTPPESLALIQVLKRCGIASDTRERILWALGGTEPKGRSNDERLISGDALFGGYYPVIAEAITIGGRITLLYRSASDKTSRVRLVDPGYIETTDEAAYLVAWDIDIDAQRSYRFDRIEHAELTDDSVVEHDFVRASASDSLAAHGKTATILWWKTQSFESCSWAGLHRDKAVFNADGSVEAPVSYTSAPWLFDRIIASGGETIITAPKELREALISYANDGSIAKY